MHFDLIQDKTSLDLNPQKNSLSIEELLRLNDGHNLSLGLDIMPLSPSFLVLKTSELGHTWRQITD